MSWGAQRRGNSRCGEDKDSDIHAHVREYLYKKIQVGVNEKSANEASGLQGGGLKTQDHGHSLREMCSPTSAGEKKRMLSEGVRNYS
jgi:hypothetical protein